MTIRITVLRVPVADAELGADRLMTAGAFAVEERASGDEHVELRAPLGDDPGAVVARLGEMPPGWRVVFDDVDSVPLDTWRAFAEPVRVTDDLILRPAWLPAAGDPGVTEIAIEPGASFGLGDHPTTRASAAVLWRCVTDGDVVLDVGCGSGALSIVAVKRGALAATAIDVSEAAVAATRANAVLNEVTDRVTASATQLGDIADEFDVVVANILAPTLIELAADLRRVTRRSGTLIISGVLADHHDHVLDALRPMVPVATDRCENWVAVELRYPRP